MDDLRGLYYDGGSLMAPIAMVGLVSVGYGLVGLVRHRFPVGLTALLAAAVCLALGYVGFALNASHTHDVLEMTSPEHHEALVAEIDRVSAIPLRFAAICAAPGILGGLVALLGARRKRDRT